MVRSFFYAQPVGFRADADPRGMTSVRPSDQVCVTSNQAQRFNNTKLSTPRNYFLLQSRSEAIMNR